MQSYVCKPLRIGTFGMGDPTEDNRVVATAREHIIDVNDHAIIKVAPHVNPYIKSDPSGGVYISASDIMKIGAVYLSESLTDNKLIGKENLRVLCNDPFTDGTCPALYKEGNNWLGHAGNTGCGDWSQLSVNIPKQTVSFFHTNANTLGMQPAISYPDFQIWLRNFAVQHA